MGRGNESGQHIRADFSAEIKTAGVKYVEKTEAREKYEKRRQFVETELWAAAPVKIDQVHQEGEESGAHTRVYLAKCDLPEALKSPATQINSEKTEDEGKKLRLVVYIPGVFESSKPNSANYPHEIKLAANLLIGDVDSVFVLKPEGLTRQTYVDKKGNPRGQTLVAKDTVEIFQKYLEALKKKHGISSSDNVEIQVVGLSEGATQAASVTAEILEKNLAKITSFTSINGAGLAGPEPSQQNKIMGFKRIAGNILKRPRDQFKDLFKETAPNTFEISGRFISEGLDKAIGTAKPRARDIAKNVATTFARLDSYNKDERPEGVLRKVLSKVGFPSKPYESGQATMVRNPAFEILAQKKIPLVFFAGTKDEPFPANLEAGKQIRHLRNIGGKILYLKVDRGHDFPFFHAAGTAYAIRTFGEKTGFYKPENPVEFKKKTSL